jgi:hypothetical protein
MSESSARSSPSGRRNFLAIKHILEPFDSGKISETELSAQLLDYLQRLSAASFSRILARNCTIDLSKCERLY